MFFIDWAQVRLIATIADPPGMVPIGSFADFGDLGQLQREAERFGLRIVNAGGAVLAVLDRAK